VEKYASFYNALRSIALT